jgi:hypothetical protein
MPPVVLLKTSIDIGALNTTLDVGSNSSLCEQRAIQQWVKTQQAIPESIQREAQTFRAAQALQECLAAQAAANMQRLMGPVAFTTKQQAATDIQRLMGPVAALKEQIAAAQAHIAPRIDSRWKETQERLQTLGAPLKAIHERGREESQLVQPVQYEVLQVQKKLQELAAPFQAFLQDLKARQQLFIDRTASKAFQKKAQRMSDINTMVRACCPLYRERHPEHEQEDWINAALTQLITQLHPGLRKPCAAEALRQQATAQHTSPQDFLRTVVFPEAI